jgi:hypothetical protein
MLWPSVDYPWLNLCARIKPLVSKIHMWIAPACEGVKFCSGDLVGCGHMSGPFARRIWPLALMEFADRGRGSKMACFG